MSASQYPTLPELPVDSPLPPWHHFAITKYAEKRLQEQLNSVGFKGYLINVGVSYTVIPDNSTDKENTWYNMSFGPDLGLNTREITTIRPNPRFNPQDDEAEQTPKTVQITEKSGNNHFKLIDIFRWLVFWICKIFHCQQKTPPGMEEVPSPFTEEFLLSLFQEVDDLVINNITHSSEVNTLVEAATTDATGATSLGTIECRYHGAHRRKCKMKWTKKVTKDGLVWQITYKWSCTGESCR